MTIEDTASVDPKGTLAGGRRYAFVIDDGDLHLIQRCYARDGRHDFASGSRTSGPNVYVDNLSVNSYNDIGAFHLNVEFLFVVPVNCSTHNVLFLWILLIHQVHTNAFPPVNCMIISKQALILWMIMTTAAR